MLAPVHKLKKDEIVWLACHYCEHKHSYLNHYSCYTRDYVENCKERIGFFDIESSNLDADYGQLLSWCIKDSLSDKIYWSIITKGDLEDNKPGESDKRLVKEFITILPTFNKLVTWYGARFDIPFIRTRAQVNKIKFPSYGTLKHQDLWYTCRGKFKLSSNRLENACRVLLGKTSKTRIEPKHWHGALQGNEASLNYILDHNKKDVLDLEKLYNKIIDYSRPQASSI